MQEQISDFSKFLDLLKQYLPYILIIIGWYTVHKYSSIRDKEKEWRDFSRQTAKYLDEITDIALEYHTSEERNRNREREIIDFLDDLDMRIGLLQKNLNLKANISSFKEAVTLENFETARFHQLEYSDRIVSKIVVSSRTLKAELYQA